jgi:ATP-dependent DNA helicase RecG
MRLVRGGEDTFLELKVKLSNTEKIAQEIVALANTSGGVIVFGVNDQLRVEGVDDPEMVQEELVRICREEVEPPLVPYVDRISFDNGRRIVALDVEGRRRPYRTRDGRFFIRLGSEKREATREELSALMDEARPLGFENVPVIGSGVDDIDDAHLWSFIREFEGDAFEASSLADYPTGEVLRRDLLLGAARMGEVWPTVAGILLFGRDERVPELLPRSEIVASRYAGDTLQAPLVETTILKGNLNSLYGAAVRFVEKYCDLWDERPRRFPGTIEESDDVPIAARSNYQRDALCESLVNLLVHRDLALRDVASRIYVFEHAIEIINPRRTEGFMPPAQKAIRFGVPMRLNPQLISLFSSPAYGLKLPQGGLPMVLRKARLFSGKRPDIHAFNDEFRIRLHGV